MLRVDPRVRPIILNPLIHNGAQLVNITMCIVIETVRLSELSKLTRCITGGGAVLNVHSEFKDVRIGRADKLLTYITNL